ncbi:putative glycoside hydrolase [Paenibacillus sp. OV219]|uniref:putative glycoside hydrolase n=1 Tax=Paenibacillus sp. OV219 TaxID=1884377 RepID=UPI0008D6CC48|nr:putative glycoside hydrolase [Paenibacillus sp. OV219]SEO05513.1 Putative glycosyl hydrolase domain-containing protein [Paenibacillus sp. OV219]
MKKHFAAWLLSALLLSLTACSEDSPTTTTNKVPSNTASQTDNTGTKDDPSASSTNTNKEPSTPSNDTGNTPSNNVSNDPSTEPTDNPSTSPSDDPSTTPTDDPSTTPSTPDFVPPYTFQYPDAVRGIYVTGWSAGGARMQTLLKLVDDTDLNAMVIDIKDDDGYITFKPEGDLAEFGQPYMRDPQALIKTLHEHNIYPIARIVAFKDTVLAKKHPELSYVLDGKVWRNGNGDGFINPFLKANWQHNVDAAILAAKLGFQEIQFDYVRFPEGFERKDKVLQYSMGEYKDKKPTKFIEEEKAYSEATAAYDSGLAPLQTAYDTATTTYNGSNTDENKKAMDDAQKALSDYKKTIPKAPDFSQKERFTQLRVDAVTDFVHFAREQLKPYGVKVSVDIFGYSATLPEAPGIGQNFSRISDNVDVISSMIYPSHWSDGYFGIKHPDIEPYRLVSEYAKREKEKLDALETPPISRPWIQDFTASWLAKGSYIHYGKEQVDAQIQALHDSGIHEFLIWNANNKYSADVNYTP